MNLQPTENEKKNRKLFNRFLGLLIFVFLVISSYGLGLERGKKVQLDREAVYPIDQTIFVNKDSHSKVIDFSLFWKVWDLLREKYVDTNELDSKKLFYGAIRGMLAATGDPYTTFFDPEENREFREEIQGSFEGIGAEVGMRGGVLTIIAPLEGSPAERAGLRAGDKVIKVGDKSTLDMTIDQSVSLMRGPKGTEVTLTIIREGEDGNQEVKITRDRINVRSVKLEWKENSIALVKISQFGDDTVGEFRSAASEIEKKGARGIILDLRNNPGGYLDAAVKIASKMLPKNALVVIEEDRNKEQEKLYALGGDILSGIPTVILINEGSASASEILAGALRDNRMNVTIVGEKSFGKGSVQEMMDLPSDSAVKITVAKWLTPKGEQINEKGIAPDKEVKLTQEDYDNDRDPQLDEALRIVQNQ